MHHKIGFLTGLKGNANGIGDYVDACEKAGAPAIIASNDSTTGISDILKIEDPVAEHETLYRVVRQGDEKYAVPDYSLSPRDAATEYAKLLLPLIPP